MQNYSIFFLNTLKLDFIFINPNLSTKQLKKIKQRSLIFRHQFTFNFVDKSTFNITTAHTSVLDQEYRHSSLKNG